MTLLAALSAATLAYLLVGAITGVQPRWLGRRRMAPSMRVRIGIWLDQSESVVSPEGFAGIVGGSMVGLSLTVFVITGIPALTVIAGLMGCVLPLATVERRRSALVRARRSAWPDALRDLGTRLRSGSTLHAALVELGRLGPEPLRPAFTRYEALAGALDHRVALENVRNELADPLADRIIGVLVVAIEQGTRVVLDILDDLAESAVADLHLFADIETAQLETKLEARGAAMLPFAVLAMLCLGSPGYRSFYTSPAGTVVILLGFVMSMTGVLVIGRLGRIEAEPRTLVPGGVAA